MRLQDLRRFNVGIHGLSKIGRPVFLQELLPQQIAKTLPGMAACRVLCGRLPSSGDCFVHELIRIKIGFAGQESILDSPLPFRHFSPVAKYALIAPAGSPGSGVNVPCLRRACASADCSAGVMST
jgi:hypothetical protein